MLDVLIRHGTLNPFDYWPERDGKVLPILFDLPPELIEHFISHKEDFIIEPDSFDIFLERFLLNIDATTNASQRSLGLLLTEYEKKNSEMEAKSYVRLRTLLQFLIARWICSEIDADLKVKNIVLKIELVLKFTRDLLRWGPRGTALDAVLISATGSEEYVLACSRKWLELLSSNSVNLRIYGQHEQRRHPEGIVAPRDFIKCCRNIHVEFVFGLLDNDLTINIRNERDSAYSHLDSAYMCEAWRRRWNNCLSQMDATCIKDGKPLASIPGSWFKPPSPNSELKLVHRGLFGWIYVDQIENGDILWYDGWEKKVWGDNYDHTDYYESGDESSGNYESDDSARSGNGDEVSHDSEENDYEKMMDDDNMESNDKVTDESL